MEKRDEETLMALILKHLVKSSIMKMISDGWASYKNLKDMGYIHSVVIHKEEFVNAEGDHTNSIESVWSQLKNWISSMHGVHEENLEDYLAEFMFRYNVGGAAMK